MMMRSSTRNDGGVSRIFSRFMQSKKGATAVEFAMIAPVLVMIIFSVLEVGRALFVKNSLQHGVEVAARHAMVNPSATTTELKTLAFSQATAIGNASGTVAFAVKDTVIDSATFTEIKAEVDHKMEAPLLSVFTISIEASTRFPKPS